MMRSLVSLLVVSCVTCSSRPALATTFDLKADFSAVHNPNGAWAYLVDGTLIPSLGSVIHDLEGWSLTGSTLDASVTRVTSDPGAHDWHMGDIAVHVPSWPYGNVLTIQWTAPEAGTVSISGRIWDADFFSDRDAQWRLEVSGTVIAERSGVRGLYRTDTGADFAANLVSGASLTGIGVQAGDQVNLMFQRLTYYGHFAGVEETIVFEPTVALADLGATWLVFSVGLISLGLLRRRGWLN